MKLSDAIFTGCETTYQIAGKMADGGKGRCALGAALHGSGLEEKLGTSPAFTYVGDLLEDAFPLLTERWECPVAECDVLHVRGLFDNTARPRRPAALRSVVPHLNDYHHWSREAIALWIATLERPAVCVIEQDGAAPLPSPRPEATAELRCAAPVQG